MKVVIATPFYPPQSGVLATYAAGFEKAFKKQGHETVVIASRNSLPPGIRHIAYAIRTFRALRDASFVLALDTWSVGLPALIAAKMHRVPCAVRIGGDFLWESYIARTGESILLSEFYTEPRRFSLKEKMIFSGTRYLTKHAAALLFTTRFQKDLWEKAYAIPAERSHIIENYFPPVVGTHLPAKGPLLVCAGREIGLKNTALLKRVVARLANDHPGLELDTRFLPPREHSRRVAEAHAVVIASISEVCSNTAIDAVVLGKPFICPKDTGTSERLGECGLFIDTRSESALTEAIESILDPNTYTRLAGAARAFSFTHSWEHMAKEIIAVKK